MDWLIDGHGTPLAQTWRNRSLGYSMRINKLADLQDMHQLVRKPLVERLANLYRTLKSTRLDFSDHLQKHWLRMWEYSSAIIESKVDSRMRVLDAGGTGTVFSFYLAAEGCQVTTVDIDDKKIKDAIAMSEYLGLKMNHRLESITELSDEDETYDRVFCICVIEHINIDQQEVAIRQLSRVLKRGGILCITFDYGEFAADYPFLSPDDVQERLVKPSGLMTLNNEFEEYSEDVGTHPIEYTFGSLFLKKEGDINIAKKRDSFLISQFPCIHQELIRTGEYSVTDSFYDTLKNLSIQSLRNLLKAILSETSYKKIEKLSHPDLIKMIESSLRPEDVLAAFDYWHGRLSES